MKQIRISQMRIGLIAAMLVMTIGFSSAMAQVTYVSTTWEHAYECDVTPAAHGPPLEDYGNATITVDYDANTANSHINVLSGNDYYHGFRYIENPGTLDSTTNGGFTIEFRIRRFGSGTCYSRLWASGDTTSRNLAIYVSNTNISIKDGDSGATDVANTNGDGEWTTFRISCDDVNWKVYRDSDQSVQAELPVVYDGGPYGLFQWQVYEVYPNLNFDLDYMRMTDEGAFSNTPPPECGEAGYKASDFNTDCYVDMVDFSYIANDWLKCTDPENVACD